MTLKNDMGEMRKIHAVTEEFLGEEGVPPTGVTRVHLVVDELVSNIIAHAFEDKGAHTITLTFGTEPGRVVVTTEDDGRNFDPLRAPSPPLGRPLEEQGRGGYGIHIVKHLTTRFEHARIEGRNRVRAVIGY